MKLSEDTLMVLGNAAKMNQHLVVDVGNKITSLNKHRSRLMICTVKEQFDKEFALHDLGGFLRQLSLFEDPNIEFGDSEFIITDDFGAKSKYDYSHKEDLQYLTRTIEFKDLLVTFELPSEALDKILRASQANGVDDIAFVGENGKVFIKTLNKDNPSRVFSVELGDTDKNFVYYFKHEKDNKLTLLPISYTVNLNKKGLLRFDGLVGDNCISYYVACERDFKYE